jgi:hypothetical protein
VEQHNIYIEKQLQESQTLEAVLKAKLEARATSVQDLRLMVSDSKEVERQLQTALTEKIDEIDQLKAELTIKKINRTSDNGIVPISYDANESMVNTLLDDFENMQNLSREAESGSPDRPANGRTMAKELKDCDTDQDNSNGRKGITGIVAETPNQEAATMVPLFINQDGRHKRITNENNDVAYSNKRRRLIGERSGTLSPQKPIRQKYKPQARFKFQNAHKEQRTPLLSSEGFSVPGTEGYIVKDAGGFQSERCKTE